MFTCCLDQTLPSNAFRTLNQFQILCTSEECESSTLESEEMICSLKRGVDWEFSTERSNYVTEFDLYCDRKYLISLGSTVYFIGFFFAVAPLSVINDKMGRKFSNELWILLHIIFLGLNSLATQIWQVLVIRTVLGALHGGLSIATVVLFYEFTSESVGTLTKMLVSAAFSFGGGLAGLNSMVTSRWEQTLYPPMCVFVVTRMAYHWIVPESPHWLFSKGMEKCAVDSLNRVAKFNGYAKLENVELVSATGQGKASKQGESLGILWSTPFFRRSLLCLSFCWFTVSICYYGLEFNAATLGNEYLVMMLMGCFDFPFKVSLYLLASSIGRQRSSQTYLGLTLICLVTSGLPHTHIIPLIGGFTLNTLLVICGRALASAVFALLYIYTSEILPTLVRSVGMSTCSACVVREIWRKLSAKFATS